MELYSLGYAVIFPGLTVVKGKSLELFALNGDDIIFPDSAPLKSTNSTKEKKKVLSALPVSGWS